MLKQVQHDGNVPDVPTLSGVEGALWPPVLHGEAAVLAAMVQQLDASQWLAPEEIARRQCAQLGAVAVHHARYSGQFHRRLAAAAMTPQELAEPGGLARLPLLTRRDIQRAVDFFSEALPPLHAPVEGTDTSGSTGEPLHVRRTALSRLDWLAITMRDHQWHGRDLAGRFCAIRAHIHGPQVVPSWGPPAGLLHATGPSLGIPMTVPIREQVRLLREFRPTSLLLYPSNLDGILDRIEEEGVALDGIRDVRTVGEIVSPALRERARAMLGATVTDTYSSQELGYIALQCPQSGLYHVMSETVIVEVLDGEGQPCPPGEIGQVVATDLRNFATPLIRYALADHAEVGPPCPCGRGLPTLARILGRSRNLMVKPNGDRSWPQVGRHRFREFGVIQYQFVQHSPEQIEARLLTEEPLPDEREAALKAVMLEALGFPFDLRITYLDGRIETGPSGKFEEFISQVSK